MSANAAKKLDEKHQKIIQKLRQDEPANKTCFDCQEKGPVYVCTTLGTFVCMTCSGLHREMQHRVKSISMASFTAAEIEQLQNMGNARAKQIWLANWTEGDFAQPRANDSPRIREFMRMKYAQKRWYREPKEGEMPPVAEHKTPVKKGTKPSPVKPKAPVVSVQPTEPVARVTPQAARAVAPPAQEENLMGDFDFSSPERAAAPAAPVPRGGGDLDLVFGGDATVAPVSAAAPAAMPEPVVADQRPVVAAVQQEEKRKNKEDIMSLFAPSMQAGPAAGGGAVAGGFQPAGFQAWGSPPAAAPAAALGDPWAAARMQQQPRAVPGMMPGMPQYSAVPSMPGMPGGLTPQQQQQFLVYQQQAYAQFLQAQRAGPRPGVPAQGFGAPVLGQPAAIPQAQPAMPAPAPPKPKPVEPDLFDSLSPLAAPSAPSAPLPAQRAPPAAGSGWGAFSSVPAAGGVKDSAPFDPFA